MVLDVRECDAHHKARRLTIFLASAWARDFAGQLLDTRQIPISYIEGIRAVRAALEASVVF